jgi:hypothetical protein
MRKCGFRDCWNQVEGIGCTWTRCNAHFNREWAPKCDACSLANTKERRFSIIYDFSDTITGENKIKESVKKNIDYKKEIIKKFLSKNISSELSQELSLVLQKVYELEKFIPELEKLAQEYAEKSQVCQREFIHEKGGQQFNIYEYCLCDNCYQEVVSRHKQLENDYQSKGLDRLKLEVEFDGIFEKVAKEIGEEETHKIVWRKDKEEKNRYEGMDHSTVKEKFPIKNEKNSQTIWIAGGVSFILLGTIICLAYHNRKKHKKQH